VQSLAERPIYSFAPRVLVADRRRSLGARARGPTSSTRTLHGQRPRLLSSLGRAAEGGGRGPARREAEGETEGRTGIESDRGRGGEARAGIAEVRGSFLPLLSLPPRAQCRRG
jgi:hypothetical protein